MQKYLLVPLALLLIAASATAQNWQAVELATTDDITGIEFISPDTGFLCTAPGEIARTYDGGRKWLFGRVAFDLRLEDISFADSQNGLVCGKAGAIYRTVNGGAGWESVSPVAGDSTKVFFSVKLFDKMNGLVTGMDGSSETPFAGLAYRTSDGGKTWTKLDGLGMGFSEIFYSPQTGAAFPAFGQVIRSRDKGKSWQKTSTNQEGLARSMAVSGDLIMLVGPKSYIGISRDGGNNFSKVSSEEEKTYVAVAIVNSKTAFIAGPGATMLATTDAGATWNKELLVRSIDVHDLAVSGNRVYAVGSGGAVIYKELQ